MNKLIKKFKREIKANPTKAAALGGTLVVAVWFWAPLLNQWFGGDSAPKPAETTASANSPAATTPVAVTPAATVRATWKQVAAWIDADQRMKAGERLAERDPFRAPELKKVEEPQTKVVETLVEPPKVSPEDAGLVLNSTLVGRKIQVARVDGKSYKVGDKIKAETKDKTEVEYRVTEIHPRRVVLMQGGQRYELTIAAPSIDGDEPAHSKPTPAPGSSSASASTAAVGASDKSTDE